MAALPRARRRVPRRRRPAPAPAEAAALNLEAPISSTSPAGPRSGPGRSLTPRRGRGSRLAAAVAAGLLAVAAGGAPDEAPTPSATSPRPTPTATPTPTPTPTAPPSPVLWSTSFADAGWADEAGVVVRSRDDTRVVAEGPEGREGVLEITFGRGGSRWGFDYRHSFAELGLEPREDVWFGYDVYLAEGFEFRGDGKLGGLAGIADGVDPLDTSAGGRYDPRSFSVRAMWREDRSVVMYLYARHGNGVDIDDPVNYGFGITAPFVAPDGSTSGLLEAGRWYRIEHHVRMNTPGQADGLYEMRIDGHLGISVADVEYRTADHPDLRVNQLFSSWFFGGDESQFPTRVNVAYTDDWVLATEPGAAPPAS